VAVVTAKLPRTETDKIIQAEKRFMSLQQQCAIRMEVPMIARGH